MERKRTGRARWVALGLTVGLVAAWGGFAVVDAAPPASITTCTKNSTSKTKVIASSLVAKCTYKGKGVAQTWSPTSQLTAAQAQAATEARYHKLLHGTVNCGGATDDYHGIDLVGLYMPLCITNGNFAGANLSFVIFVGTNATGTNFTGANFTQSYLSGANFLNANLTNANLTNAYIEDTILTGATTAGTNITGTNWANVTCPDLTNSNSNGNTCAGHGF
jgi:hypothetical protein